MPPPEEQPLYLAGHGTNVLAGVIDVRLPPATPRATPERVIPAPLDPRNRRYQVVTERTIRDVLIIEAPDFAAATTQAMAIDGVQEVISVTRADALP